MINFHFTFKGIDSSDAIKKYAEKKFKKFEKYFFGPISAQIVFKREKFRDSRSNFNWRWRTNNC